MHISLWLCLNCDFVTKNLEKQFFRKKLRETIYFRFLWIIWEYFQSDKNYSYSYLQVLEFTNYSYSYSYSYRSWLCKSIGLGVTVLCMHTATWPGRGLCLAETVCAGSKERLLFLFGNGLTGTGSGACLAETVLRERRENFLVMFGLIEHYINLNNGILKSNSSIFPRSEGYITQYTP